jgi:signal peptidase I
MRLLFHVAVSVLIAGLIVRTWLVEWFVVPSGSMAPTLLGVHRDATCPACGHRFACGTEKLPAEGQRILCPNCGDHQQEFPAGPDLAGDRLLVDKQAFHSRAPRRWEVVAFHIPRNPRNIAVKRVVGLPGEDVQLIDGDVFINGQRERKTLAQQRALGILVHEESTTAENNAAAVHWRAEPGLGQWHCSHGHFVRPSSADIAQKSNERGIDWLIYHHRGPVPGEATPLEDVPIDDRYAYNQTQFVRESHLVRDLFFTCRLRMRDAGAFYVRASDGQGEFLARLNTSTGDGQVIRNGQRILEFKIPSPFARQGERLTVSLVDCQFMLALGRTTVVKVPYERPQKYTTASPRPFAIGVQDAGIDVWDLRVFRDISYVWPPELTATNSLGLGQSLHLGPTEFFVLGDNSPFSFDSRYQQFGTVSSEYLLGKPLLVYFPSRLVDWGWVRIPVPEVSKIRYIP